jgi:hypothetical protein
MRFPKQHAEMLLNLLRSVASPGESSEPNSKRRRLAETDQAGAESALLRQQLENAKYSHRIANENFEILGAHCEQVLRDVHKKHISAEEGIARIMTRVWEPGDSDSDLDSDSDSEPQFCSSCRMKH